MNIQIVELKAKAYDILAAIEQLQIELQKINKQISEVQQANNATGNNNNNSN